MSLQNSRLLTFLASRRVESGSGQETHQLGFDRSLYKIPDADLTEFYSVYCQYVDAGYGGITMLEKMTRVGPLRVDLDFVYEGKHAEHLHTQKNTTDFIRGYMTEVAKYMEVNEITDVYVMQKVDPTYYPGKNHTKSGIHLVVPSIRTNKFIENKVRDAMLKQMEAYFPGLPIKGWNDAYDKLVLGHSTFWPLLGSKKPDKDGGQPLPYKLAYVAEWDPVDGKVAVDEEREHGISPALVRKFSVRALPTEETATTPLGSRFTLPEEDTRISGGSAVLPQRGRPANRSGEPGSRDSSPTRVIYQQPLTDAQKDYYSKHVDNLADTRHTEYKEWLDVGICLKNIHPDLNDLWHTFSQKAQEKYDFRETEAKWMSFGFRNDGSKLGVGSLRYWSRGDNPVRYLEIEKSNIDHLIKESVLSQTEHDVAQVVFAKYRDEFKCVKYGANVWYRFMGHVWRETDKGIALQTRLSSDVMKEYKYYVLQEDTLQFAGNLSCPPGKHDPNTCDMCQSEKKKKPYADIIKALKKTGFKKSVMDECRELFLDEEFANKVDENKRLIAFRNGVLDMNAMPPVFRDGKPEDYISFCTNLDFDPKKPYYEYDCWSELNKFIHDVLPDTEVRTYFLSYLANALSGENDAQKFHILTGEGSNGKSMLMILMSTTMGDYACTAPISLLTQGRNKSAAAAPELVRMKGRRFVTMQEPDEQVPLNTGLMKELASSEKITARDLYAGSKAMIDFELQARFNLACNEKPKINTTDGGTWRRYVVVGFPNKFVFAPKLPHEKLMNESMKQNCMSEAWATAFLSYLVHLFTEGNGLRKLAAPEKVMEYIAEYKEDSDVIAKFLREKIHAHPPLAVDEQAHEGVSWNSITMTFGEWKRSNELMGKGTPADLKKRLEATHGKMPRGGWVSFRCGDA